MYTYGTRKRGDKHIHVNVKEYRKVLHLNQVFHSSCGSGGGKNSHTCPFYMHCICFSILQSCLYSFLKGKVYKVR